MALPRPYKQAAGGRRHAGTQVQIEQRMELGGQTAAGPTSASARPPMRPRKYAAACPEGKARQELDERLAAPARQLDGMFAVKGEHRHVNRQRDSHGTKDRIVRHGWFLARRGLTACAGTHPL